MVGKKNGADFGTVKGVLGLFLFLTISRCNKFNHLEVGWSDNVISSSLICIGDIYSGSSPKSILPKSSISGFSGAVLGNPKKQLRYK